MSLILGDAVSVMKSMEEKSFEVVVTSPPYNIGMEYGVSKDDIPNYDDWTIAWLTEALRVCKRGVMLNIATKASEHSRLYRTLGKIASLWTIQNTFVWAKSVHVEGRTVGHLKPVNSSRYVNQTHELILHVVEETVEVDRLAVGVPYSDKSNVVRFGERGRPDLRCNGSVWFVPYETRQKTLQHPASYPVELARRMIQYAGGNGPVLDPFVGSGSTILAGKMLGREVVGIDLNPEYLTLSESRLAA